MYELKKRIYAMPTSHIKYNILLSRRNFIKKFMSYKDLMAVLCVIRALVVSLIIAPAV